MKKIVFFAVTAIAVLFSNATFSQISYPGGDSCEVAVPIPVGDGYDSPSGGVSSDHWYSFVAPCDGDLTLTNSDGTNSGKRIYTGVCGSEVLESEGTWADTEISHPMLAGESVFIVINDSWDGMAAFNVEYTACAEVDSALLDVSGIVYYDMNDNGVQDPGELPKALTLLYSDPVGLFTVSGYDGFYYSSVAALDDGEYELYPEVDEYWRISSDSLVYTLNIDDTYEQRDSLHFGIHPDTIIYEVTPDLIGGFPRCNDTINYWLNIQNTGTTIASGNIHLELDDSLYYVDSDIVPDSIVGQNIYWAYENLFFEEFKLIIVEVGTPDGLEDTVTSNLDVTVDTSGIEVFAADYELTQTITCAYDPNDKTPKPLGEGEMGNIPPDTENLEYLIRFQNTGTDTAFNVVITDQLDENLDWYSLNILGHSHLMTYEMDMDGEVSFIFNNIMLPDSNVDVMGSQGFVKFNIDLKPDLPLGTSIYNTGYIYFDFNPAVITNTAVNTLFEEDNIGIEELNESKTLSVYPNPFTEMTTITFEEDLNEYSIQIVDVLGNQVYMNNNINGNQLEIDGSQFNAGMYILVLLNKTSNEVVSNTKLVVK